MINSLQIYLVFLKPHQCFFLFLPFGAFELLNSFKLFGFKRKLEAFSSVEGFF